MYISVLPGGFPTTTVLSLNFLLHVSEARSLLGKLSELNLADRGARAYQLAPWPRFGGPLAQVAECVAPSHIPYRHAAIYCPRPVPGVLQISVHLLRVLFSFLNRTMASFNSGPLLGCGSWGLFMHRPLFQVSSSCPSTPQVSISTPPWGAIVALVTHF